MKIIKYLCAFALLLSSVFTAYAEENKVVAKVNDYEITQYQVNALVTSRLQKTFFHQKLSGEKQKELNKEALDELINRELLYLYAKKININIDQKIIQDEKEKIKKRFKSDQDFQAVLKKNNLTEKNLERDIDAEETMKVLYKDKIETVLSDEDLKEYYEENKYKFKKPESKSYQILLINIDPTKKEGRDEAKEHIESLYKKLQEGEDFAEIAQKYSHDMSRINGGNVGFIHKGRFKYLKEEDLEVKKGELSPIISTDIGFYVIKLLDVKPEEQLSFEQVEKNLKKELRTSKEREKLNNILDTQKKSVKIVYFN